MFCRSRVVIDRLPSCQKFLTRSGGFDIYCRYGKCFTNIEDLLAFQCLYRDILRKEFETDTCFYCGRKLHKTPHVDHVIPWSFIKSDHLWNFVLACPSCNTRKKDQLPNRQKLAAVVTRNESLSNSDSSIVRLEFEGYNENLLWQLWDYAYKRGLHVYQP